MSSDSSDDEEALLAAALALSMGAEEGGHGGDEVPTGPGATVADQPAGAAPAAPVACEPSAAAPLPYLYEGTGSSALYDFHAGTAAEAPAPALGTGTATADAAARSGAGSATESAAPLTAAGAARYSAPDDFGAASVRLEARTATGSGRAGLYETAYDFGGVVVGGSGGDGGDSAAAARSMAAAAAWPEGYDAFTDGDDGADGGGATTEIAAPPAPLAAAPPHTPSPAEAASGAGAATTDAAADDSTWNDKFQVLLGRVTQTPADAKRRQQQIKALTDDFVRSQRPVVRTIVEEAMRGVPMASRTVRPFDAGGVAGGLKFVHEGVIFKFAQDFSGLYGGDEFSAKAAKHELRGADQLMACQVPGVHLPLTAVFDHLGFRVSATALLPIDGSTLAYGSADGGASVLADERCDAPLSVAAQRLNLKPHNVCGKTLQMAGDVEGHFGRDGRLVIIDTARVFPPAVPSDLCAVLVPADASEPLQPVTINRAKPMASVLRLLADRRASGGGDAGRQPLRVLRSRGSRSAVVVSFSRGADGAAAIEADPSLPDNPRAASLCWDSREVLPTAAPPASSTHTPAADDPAVPVTVRGDAVLLEVEPRTAHLVRMLRPELCSSNAVPLSPDALSGWGRDGAEQHNAEVLSATQRLLFECVPLASKALMRMDPPAAGREDEEAQRVSDVLHSHGVNLRLMGHVRSCLRDDTARARGWRRVLLCCMVARTFRAELNSVLRALAKSAFTTASSSSSSSSGGGGASDASVAAAPSEHRTLSVLYSCVGHLFRERLHWHEPRWSAVDAARLKTQLLAKFPHALSAPEWQADACVWTRGDVGEDSRLATFRLAQVLAGVAFSFDLCFTRDRVGAGQGPLLEYAVTDMVPIARTQTPPRLRQLGSVKARMQTYHAFKSAITLGEAVLGTDHDYVRQLVLDAAVAVAAMPQGADGAIVHLGEAGATGAAGAGATAGTGAGTGAGAGDGDARVKRTDALTLTRRARDMALRLHGPSSAEFADACYRSAKVCLQLEMAPHALEFATQALTVLTVAQLSAEATGAGPAALPGGGHAIAEALSTRSASDTVQLADVYSLRRDIYVTLGCMQRARADADVVTSMAMLANGIRAVDGQTDKSLMGVEVPHPGVLATARAGEADVRARMGFKGSRHTALAYDATSLLNRGGGNQVHVAEYPIAQLSMSRILTSTGLLGKAFEFAQGALAGQRRLEGNSGRVVAEVLCEASELLCRLKLFARASAFAARAVQVVQAAAGVAPSATRLRARAALARALIRDPQAPTALSIDEACTSTDGEDQIRPRTTPEATDVAAALVQCRACVAEFTAHAALLASVTTAPVAVAAAARTMVAMGLVREGAEAAVLAADAFVHAGAYVRYGDARGGGSGDGAGAGADGGGGVAAEVEAVPERDDAVGMVAIAASLACVVAAARSGRTPVAGASSLATGADAGADAGGDAKATIAAAVAACTEACVALATRALARLRSYMDAEEADNDNVTSAAAALAFVQGDAAAPPGVGRPDESEQRESNTMVGSLLGTVHWGRQCVMCGESPILGAAHGYWRCAQCPVEVNLCDTCYRAQPGRDGGVDDRDGRSAVEKGLSRALSRSVAPSAAISRRGDGGGGGGGDDGEGTPFPSVHTASHMWSNAGHMSFGQEEGEVHLAKVKAEWAALEARLARSEEEGPADEDYGDGAAAAGSGASAAAGASAAGVGEGSKAGDAVKTDASHRGDVSVVLVREHPHQLRRMQATLRSATCDLCREQCATGSFACTSCDFDACPLCVALSKAAETREALDEAGEAADAARAATTAAAPTTSTAPATAADTAPGDISAPGDIVDLDLSAAIAAAMGDVAPPGPAALPSAATGAVPVCTGRNVAGSAGDPMSYRSMDGNDAISAAIKVLYPDQAHDHVQFTASVKFWLGGPDPLDYVSALSHKGDPARGVPPHWHYISFGFSDINGHVFPQKPPGYTGPSGFGFEMTLRLRKGVDPTTGEVEARPPIWPAVVMNRMARYVHSSGATFNEGEFVQGAMLGEVRSGELAMEHMILVHDEAFKDGMVTQAGRVNFLQVTAVTDAELQLVRLWEGRKLVHLMRSWVGGVGPGPLLVTDASRVEELQVHNPLVLEAVAEGMARHGSRVGVTSADFTWEEGNGAEPPPIEAPGGGGGNGAAPEPWACGACTLINEPGAASCSVCGTPNPSGGATSAAPTAGLSGFPLKPLRALLLRVTEQSALCLSDALLGRIAHGRPFVLCGRALPGTDNLMPHVVFMTDGVPAGELAGAGVDDRPCVSAERPVVQTSPHDVQLLIPLASARLIAESLKTMEGHAPPGLPRTLRWPDLAPGLTLLVDKDDNVIYNVGTSVRAPGVV